MYHEPDGGLHAVITYLQVRAHRHHPSIAVWSLCNEGECDTGVNRTTHQRLHNRTLYSQFRDVTKRLDPQRVVSGVWHTAVGAILSLLVQSIDHLLICPDRLGTSMTIVAKHKRVPQATCLLSMVRGLSLISSISRVCLTHHSQRSPVRTNEKAATVSVQDACHVLFR